MTLRNRTLAALSVLLPAGAFGMSLALAAAPHATTEVDAASESVAARLQAIRAGVSTVTEELPVEPEADPNITKVWWGNGGWRPGWGNGGWRPGWGNGGWRNGGWRNGGWRNGGWPNFWRNW
ncbi:MAG TPA: GrrA/OscA1 family cyclophane-containing rSAM-modified RiPP [Acetobacteraceae bacterium]|nr:GrrA/OscA1 family cyclophane-containing rSAM-modified RiPP [Acetobacteraceae bacterium]